MTPDNTHPPLKGEPTGDGSPLGELPTSIEATLAERGNRYGSFDEHARITQNLKATMADSPNWSRLAPDQKEALEMVAHKAGRILNGDPDYHDSWHDIVGYTKLVADRLLATPQQHNTSTGDAG